MSKSYHDLDIHRLDEEWVGQISLYREHAQQLADANKLLSEAETELEVRKAELKETVARLDLAIRKDPELYDLERVTEGAIDKVVLLRPDYVKAKEEVFSAMRRVNEARHFRDVCKVANDTVGHQRKAALQDLVQLWLASYFAEPKLPRDSGGREMSEAGQKSAFGGRPRPKSE